MKPGQKAWKKQDYYPVRVDKLEHINKIEIIVRINKAKFVVVDFICHRGDVFFETGYALGLSIF